ncbi:hypothetical protein JAAARDRAFT_139766, partial [Jaapia argillacea MUCL 33604]
WCSPIYSFFKLNVMVEYQDGRLYHFFPCAARKCKNPLKGVCHYQDSKDKSSTSNLKSHVTGCFGAAAVDTVMKGDSALRDGSIFSAFTHQGQCLVTVSHHMHTNVEVCAHLIKWLTESNQPANILNNCEFHELMTAGHPNLSLPSPRTVSHDIHTAFEKC